MSDVSDDDIFCYQSLSTKPKSSPYGHSSNTSSQSTKTSRKSKEKKKKGNRKKTQKKKTPKKEIEFVVKTPDDAQGPGPDAYCPMCQMPLSIAIGSPEQHVARCIIEHDRAAFEGECPLGMNCDVTIRQHFQRYSHNVLSQRRAGVETFGHGDSTSKDKQPSRTVTQRGARQSLQYSSSKMSDCNNLITTNPSNSESDSTMALTNLSNSDSLALPLEDSLESSNTSHQSSDVLLTSPTKNTARKTFPHSPRQFNPKNIVMVLEPVEELSPLKPQCGNTAKPFSFKKGMSVQNTKLRDSRTIQNDPKNESNCRVACSSKDQAVLSGKNSAINFPKQSSNLTANQEFLSNDLSNDPMLQNNLDQSASSSSGVNCRLSKTEGKSLSNVNQDLRDNVKLQGISSKSRSPESQEPHSPATSRTARMTSRYLAVKSCPIRDGDPDESSPPKKSKKEYAKKSMKCKRYPSKASAEAVVEMQGNDPRGRHAKKGSLEGAQTKGMQNGVDHMVNNGVAKRGLVFKRAGGDAVGGSLTFSDEDDSSAFDDPHVLEASEGVKLDWNQNKVVNGQAQEIRGSKQGKLSSSDEHAAINGQAEVPSSPLSSRTTASPSLLPQLDEESEEEALGLESDDIQLTDVFSTPTEQMNIPTDGFFQSSTGSSTSTMSNMSGTSDLTSTDPSARGSSKSSWSNIFKQSKGTKFSERTTYTLRRETSATSGFQSNSGRSASSESSMWATNKKRQCPFYKKMPGTTFTVDAFSYGDIPGITAYFLTHFHADHYGGLTKTFTNPIYCSEITANLVKTKLYVPSQYVHPLAMEREHIVEGIKVTFLDANHCPGSVLILFSLPNGQRYLHTGDFRAHTKMESYQQLQNCRIDHLYLDTTYLDPKYDFPKQDEVVQYAVDLAVRAVQENPKTLVMCGTYTIGKERVFRAISDALGCKICVESDKKRVLSCFNERGLMDRIVTDKKATRLHVVSMTKLVLKRLSLYLDEFHNDYDSIIAFKPTGWTHSSKSSSLADIKPSTWGRVKVYGIPYSEHSSYSEMKRFVQFIRSSGPVRIIPTVNVGRPEHRAVMESHFKAWLSEDYRDLPRLDPPSSQRSQASTSRTPKKTLGKSPTASQEKTLLSFFKKL